MIHYLHLVNFKKHADLELEFGPGLQLIRGANEAGKSSIFLAIVYVLFGVRATGYPLSELATWGQPENSMRVEIKFSHAGKIYLAYRSKSGAELSSEGLLVSGTSEVTRFVEQLFNVSADTAAKLNLSKQSSLSGALASGPSGAVQLIERLADFSLFETLIERIQSQLVSGNTSNLEATIAQDESILKPEPVDPKHSLFAELRALEAFEKQFKAEHAEVTSGLEDLDTEQAQEILSKAQTLEAGLGRSHARLQEVKVKTKQLSRPSGLPTETLEELLAGKARKESLAFQIRARNVYQAVGAGRESDKVLLQFPGLDAANVEIERLKAERSEIFTSKREAELQLTKLKSSRWPDVCEWCQKDLSNVPEVAARREEIEVAKAACNQTLGTLQGRSACVEEAIAELLLAVESAKECLHRAVVYPEYIQVTREWPPQFKWIGPESDTLDTRNYESDIKRLTEGQQAIAAYEATQARLEEEAQALQKQISQDQQRLSELDLANAKDTLDVAQQLQKQLAAINGSLQRASNEINETKAQIATLVNSYEIDFKLWQAAQQRLTTARSTLSAMKLHNRVIKRLREARPEVARRLWAVVMAAISHYFSLIRGTPTVVVRSEDGFLADGHPVHSYSGSTIDSLGLAIRLALSQTFLPNLRFMLMDEPAAGMDKEREALMLGLLSSCGLEQIIMVTHSEQAESFAKEIIQL